MTLGIVYSILSSASFGLNAATIRRGVLGSSASQGLYITVALGVPLFFIAALLSGEIFQAGRLPLAAYAGLALAGVMHFLFGRYCNYRAIGAIGANRVTPIRATSLIYSVVVAVVALGERFTVPMALGTLLILVAALLVAERPVASRASTPAAIAAAGRRGEVRLTRRQLMEGYIFGLLSAAAYGLSPVIIRAALENTGLSILGGFVSYTAATLALAVSLSWPGRVGTLRSMNSGAVGWFVLGAVTVFAAQFFRYLALGVAPVVLVAPLSQTNAVFTVGFSFLINRRTESFAPLVGLGIALSVAGSVALAFAGQA